ncbi:MAG: hypothetical protein P1U65_11605 [Minwuia sp.]|nr:hypothetical protein [Minwuia sp.]
MALSTTAVTDQDVQAGAVDGADAVPLVSQWLPEPMPSLADAKDPAERRKAGNSVLFLSLYLILLAFFIMLNARAEVSSVRTKAVIAGLGLPVDVSPVVEPRPMALVADELEQRLGTLFRHEFASTFTVISSGDGRMVVSLPMHRVFDGDTAVLRPQRLSMMRRLAEVLGELGKRESLAVALQVPRGTQPDLAIRQAAALGRDLVRNGIDPADFTIRIDPEKTSGQLRFALARVRDERS